MAMCGEIEIKDNPPDTTLQSQWKAVLQEIEEEREKENEVEETWNDASKIHQAV